MTEDKWKMNKRQAGGLVGVVFMLIGIFFNSYVFNFSGHPLAWVIGLAIGVCISILQLEGNQEDELDDVLTWVWYFSYVFGISCNAYGIYVFLGDGLPWMLKYAVAIPLGVIIDVTPERLILLSLGIKLKKLSSNPNPQKNEPGVESRKVEGDDVKNRIERHKRFQEQRGRGSPSDVRKEPQPTGRPVQMSATGGWKPAQEPHFHDPLGDDYREFTKGYQPPTDKRQKR